MLRKKCGKIFYFVYRRGVHMWIGADSISNMSNYEIIHDQLKEYIREELNRIKPLFHPC